MMIISFVLLFVMFNSNSLETYALHSPCIGNELSGKGIVASVVVIQYGRDLINLKQNLNTQNTKFKPLLIAPGGFYQKEWFDQLLQVSGPGVVDVMTYHVYKMSCEHGNGCEHVIM